MQAWLCRVGLVVSVFVAWSNITGASADELFKQAQELASRGDGRGAMEKLNQAIEADNKMPEVYFFRGKLYSAASNPQQAIADFDKVLALAPDKAHIYQWRGGEWFKVGRFDASIADFDQFLKVYPQEDPNHWQRGISYYYAGRYEEGRRQFERHQTVNSNDVENAVWHFLCVAKVDGVEAARSKLIPIEGDARVPMAQVHQLFAGKGSVEEVLKAAEAGEIPAAAKQQRMFYAHLYLGLYFDATGDVEKARQHILAAAGKYAVNNYMGDVARVHARRFAKAK